MMRWKWTGRLVVGSLVGVAGLYLLVFVVCWALLRVPSFQERIRPWAIRQAEAALGTRVELERIELQIFDRIDLRGFALYDRNGVRAIAADRLQIGVFSFPTVSWFTQPEGVKRILARSLRLEGGGLNLYRERESRRLNLSRLFDPEPSPPDTRPPAAMPPLWIEIDEVELARFGFRWSDSTEADRDLAPQPGHLQYQALYLDSVNLRTSLSYRPDGFTEGIVQHLSAREANSGLELKRGGLTARSIPATDSSAARVEVREAILEVAGSFLNLDLDMPGQTFATLIEEGHNRRFDARLRQTVFDWATLNFFLKEDLALQGPLTLEGRIWGDYRTVRCRDLEVRYGEETRLRLSARLRNYIDPARLFIEAELNETNLAIRDLRQLLPKVQLPAAAQALEYARIDGRFTGFWHDFVARATFATGQGQIVSDLNLKYDSLTTALTYSGRLRTENLNLERLIGQKSTARLNLTAEVRGRSLDARRTTASASFQLSDSEVYGYVIDSAKGRVQLREGDLDADFVLEDREGSFRGQLDVDLGGPMPHYRAVGELRTLDLAHYGLTDRPLQLSTLLNVDLIGGNLDELEGLITVEDMFLYHADKPQPLKSEHLSLRIESESDSVKVLEAQGSTFALQARGRFGYLNLAKRVENMTQSLLRRYLPDSTTRGTSPASPCELSLTLTTRELDPWLEFVDLPLRIKPGTQLQADYRGSRHDSLYATLLSDSISWGAMPLRQVAALVKLDLNTQTDTVNLQLNAYAAHFALSSDFVIENPGIEIEDLYGVLYYDVYYEQNKFKNKVRIAGDAVFDESGMLAQLDDERCYLTLNDSVWRVVQAAPIVWGPGLLQIDSLRIEQGDHRLTCTARIGDPLRDEVRIVADAFDLSLVEGFYDVGVKLNGRVNADLRILNPRRNYLLLLQAQVEGLRVEGVKMGRISARSRLEEGSEALATDLDWISDTDTILRIRGFYRLDAPEAPLDLVVSAQRFPLELFHAFVQDYVPTLEGQIYLSEIRIRGSLAEPDLQGRGRFDGHFALGFLGEHFLINDGFELRGQQLLIRDLVLRNYESRGRRVLADRSCRLDGSLTLLPELRYRIQARQIGNLRVMQTTAATDQPIYGTVVIERGQALIEGDLKGLRINSPELYTGTGTVLSLPISDYSERQRLSYIRFVGSGASDALANQATKRPQAQAFELEFQLTAFVSPQAEINLIFDERLGDQIRVRGSGALNVRIDPDANVSLSGQYSITEGDYLFTFANVFNRRFRITSGTLNWVDDPIDARVDLRAVYRLEQANLRAWDTLQSLSTKLDVVMNMTGSLLQPNITFGIEAPAVTQNQSFIIAQTLRLIENDPQELNRQVFSLIVTGSVAPVGQFLGSGAGAGAASASMSEFLSNQLNTIIGRTVGQNIGISFGYNDRVLVMNFRASLLNNRITIERNGAISSGGPNRDITLGNLSVQYRILPTTRRESVESGQLVAELFNRENLVTGAFNTTTRGVGLFYRKEFDFVKRPPRELPLEFDEFQE